MSDRGHLDTVQLSTVSRPASAAPVGPPGVYIPPADYGATATAPPVLASDLAAAPSRPVSTAPPAVPSPAAAALLARRAVSPSPGAPAGRPVTPPIAQLPHAAAAAAGAPAPSGRKDVEAALPKLPAGPLSVSAATAVVLKALLGASLFSQPWAMAQAGTLALSLTVAIITLVCLYTAQMLVTVRRAALALVPPPPGSAVPLASLPALVDVVLGPSASLLAEGCVLLACFGILAAYLAFASQALWPLLPSEHLWLLVWGVTPGAAVLCLARGMEHAALMSALGNVAALVAAGGIAAFYLSQLASRGWRGDELPAVAPSGAWNADAFGAGGTDGVPLPMAALACSASGFLVHFTLPAVEAAMSTPRRAMEAVGRGFGAAAVALLAFGALGAVAGGVAAPREAYASMSGAPALLLRVAVALDALTTAPVLVRPGLLVAEAWWERSTVSRLGTPGAAALRCAFVAAAATAAAVESSSRLGTLLPVFTGAAAMACSLLLPAAMLLVGADSDGEPLVRTSLLERSAAGTIAAMGCGAVLFGAMATAGSIVDVPFPFNAPPAPPPLAEYDYDAPPLRYAFTRASASTDLAMDAAAGGTGPGGGGGNQSAQWANSWNHTWANNNNNNNNNNNGNNASATDMGGGGGGGGNGNWTGGGGGPNPWGPGGGGGGGGAAGGNGGGDPWAPGGGAGGGAGGAGGAGGGAGGGGPNPGAPGGGGGGGGGASDAGGAAPAGSDNDSDGQ